MSTLDIGLDDELGTPRMATDGGGPNRNGNRRRGGGAKRKKTAPVRILGAEEQEDGRGLGASEDESEFVLLIPDEFMGSILGRGGSTIRRLQWQTHTTIKCSNSDDLYPGTTSRKVTLVSSSAAAMDAAQSLVMLQVAQNYPETFREVGVVIPDELAGRVIGKGGDRISVLREMCEHCDLTPKDRGRERMLIISGNVVQITRAVRQVIDHLIQPSAGAP
jgi:predicted RNA-binding protein YlqC (UPF0109 family)